jgi:quinoprotein glucose dehydrogenase
MRLPAVGLTVQGLPIVKPPYGLLAAIDLDRGRLDVAGAARRHAGQHPQSSAPARDEHSKDGAVGHVGCGIARDQDARDHGRSADYDDADAAREARCCVRTTRRRGSKVGEVWMPAQQSGSPMTYSVGGKQYIIVAVSGGAYSGEYLAFSLPDSSTTTAR